MPTRFRLFARQAAAAIATFAALAGASVAHAEAYCSAVPSEVFTANDGMVVVLTPSRNDWVGVCSVKSAWKGISTEVCWNWFSTITTAVTQRKVLGLYYPSLTQEGCAGLPTYGNSPAAYYVRISG